MKTIMIILAIAAPSMAFATPVYMKEYKETHKDKTVTCTTCHEGKPSDKKLNAEGTEFKKALEAKKTK